VNEGGFLDLALDLLYWGQLRELKPVGIYRIEALGLLLAILAIRAGVTGVLASLGPLFGTVVTDARSVICWNFDGRLVNGAMPDPT
jgi:hypothetical protein